MGSHVQATCTNTRAMSSHSSLSSHTNVDSAREGKLAEGKSFGQRSLDNRAPSYRRASLRRGKDADKEGKEDRKTAGSKGKEKEKLALLQSQLAYPRGNHSSLREPSGLEIVRKRLPGCSRRSLLSFLHNVERERIGRDSQPTTSSGIWT